MYRSEADLLRAVNRIPVSLRTLLLLPLLAAGVDLTRAAAACGSQAQTCLEAAGRGWLGPAAAILIVLYALATAHFVARRAQSRDRRGFAELWLLGTTGVAIACTGQAVLARAFAPEATLGGSPLGVLALCAIAGALLAMLLRATDELAEHRPRAPRLRRRPQPAVVYVRTDDGDPRAAARQAPRGRAPPSV